MPAIQQPVTVGDEGVRHPHCRRRALLAAALLAAPLPLSAQWTPEAEPPPVDAMGDIGFTIAFPAGAFADNLDRNGLGMGFFAGIRAGSSPIVLGLQGAILGYGSRTDRVPFSGPVGPRVQVDVVTSNNIFLGHLALRLQPKRFAVRPYVEVLGGFEYLVTRTSVEGVDFGADATIASDTNHDDFAWSGGAGAGLDVPLFTAHRDEERPIRLGLHVGGQDLLGSTAEYLADAELVDLDGDGRLQRDEMDVRESRTDLYTARVGLSVSF